MILWRIFHFSLFNTNPRFPPFLLYVRWKSGVAFVRRCFRDENAVPMQKLCHGSLWVFMLVKVRFHVCKITLNHFWWLNGHISESQELLTFNLCQRWPYQLMFK